MRVRDQHYNVVMTGQQQALPLPLGAQGIRLVALTADPENAAPIYVGGGNQDLTTSVWGMMIPKPLPVDNGGVTVKTPYPPLFIDAFLDGTSNLDDTRVLGTNGDILHVYIKASL